MPSDLLNSEDITKFGKLNLTTLIKSLIMMYKVT